MKLFVIAGEKSGDAHAAYIMQELQKQSSQQGLELEIAGLGGQRMLECCPQVEDWSEHSAVMGFVEVMKRIGYFRRQFKSTLKRIVDMQADAVVFVDYPGFNLRMAKAVRKALPNCKLIYYISPQVWAWHKGRIPKMAKLLDLMLCIFPFEVPLYAQSGLSCHFVGHPLADAIKRIEPKHARQEELIGLFPGSRRKEIERIFPTMLQASAVVHANYPQWNFVVAASSPSIYQQLQNILQHSNIPDSSHIRIEQDSYHQLLQKCTCGVVTSGTATLEAGMHGMPYVLVYAMAPSTYFLARLLVKIKFIGMVNILAGRRVVEEYIQQDFSATKVATWLTNMMLKPLQRQALAREMQEVLQVLDHGNAAANAANHILCCMQGKSASTSPSKLN